MIVIESEECHEDNQGDEWYMEQSSLPTSQSACYAMSHIHTPIHTLLAETTVQDATCYSALTHSHTDGAAIGINLGFSTLPSDTHFDTQTRGAGD